MYRQLRDLMPAGDVINASNLELRRDAATLTFHQGSFAFTIKGHPVPAMRVNTHRKFSAHYVPSSKEILQMQS